MVWYDKLMKKLVITIKGTEWTVKIQTNAAFARQHGVRIFGVVYPYDREIYFNKGHLTLAILRHELYHALLHSLDMEFTDGISPGDMEEICATAYANNKLSLQDAEDRILNFILGGSHV